MQMPWPQLHFHKWKDTYATLHLFTQIIGKIKLSKMPWINHSWHVTLLVSPLGLTTSDIADEKKHFQMEFNFIKHQLNILTSDGESEALPLEGLSVADFYKKVITTLNNFNIDVNINTIPNEMIDVISFDKDTTHATYQPEAAEALHKAFLNIQDVFITFRARFVGKCSPVHFFWGGFDLACTRFSGREAPKHPGGVPNLPNWVAEEAYSHEVSSCGFWPGSEAVPFAAFYSYAYPEPDGYKEYSISPEEAYYHNEMREFLLPYEAVQKAEDGAAMLLQFLQTTYDAAAQLGNWDKVAFEK